MTDVSTELGKVPARLQHFVTMLDRETQRWMLEAGLNLEFYAKHRARSVSQQEVFCMRCGDYAGPDLCPKCARCKTSCCACFGEAPIDRAIREDEEWANE